jgi:DNA-binding NarL/FixJ family response regulator
MRASTSEEMTVARHREAIAEEEWTELKQCLGLSQLQTDIVKRLFLGRSCHEIARDLVLRPRTVRTQTHRLYTKFGVSNRIQLILRILASLRAYGDEEGESLCV